MWSFLGLALSGQLRELITRVRAASEDAARREDRRVEQNVSLGAPAIVWLLLDSPAEALARADRALGYSPTDYTVQHYQHFVTCVDAELYLGRGEAAWERTLATWPAHKKEFFLSLVFCRDDLLRCRGRAALATVLQLQREGRASAATGHTRAELLREASRAARSMARHGLPCSRGWAALLQAGISQMKAEKTVAITHLQAAVQEFEEADACLFAEVARYCLGELAQDAVGKKKAQDWFTEQGVVNPARLVDTLATGVIVLNI